MDDLIARTFIIFVLSTFWNASTGVPCNSKFGVDISDGKILDDGSIVKEGFTYIKGNYVDSGNGTTTGCICNFQPCLRKCCPLGEYMQNRTCEFTETPFVIPSMKGPSADQFHIINGFDCPPKKQRSLLNPRINQKLGEFIIQNDGTLYLPHSEEQFEQMDYCVDYIEEQDVIKGLICTDNSARISATNMIGMIISMPFLLTTFLVYVLLPERNLHGKSLMCYVITLFAAYLLLVIIQQHPNDLEDDICVAVGILCLFFFMVSFFLMNVMSIDIWWTFSGLRGFSGTRKESERKRFLLYSCYAWGVPLLLVSVVIYFTLDSELPQQAWYIPGIASGQCWFQGEMPKLLYFYGPIAILITTNLILFILTAFKIKKVQRDTAVLRKDDSKRHNYEHDKQKFNLYLKLMLAMGVNWFFEIISWIVDWKVGHVPPAVWYFTDFLNALYGVLIFLIFVFKKSILRSLKKRYYMIVGEPNPADRITTLVDYSPPSAKQKKISATALTTDNKAFVTSEVA